MAYQFDDKEMKLVRDALTIYYDACYDHYKNAPTPEIRQRVLEATGELEMLMDRMEAHDRQDTSHAASPDIISSAQPRPM